MRKSNPIIANDRAKAQMNFRSKKELSRLVLLILLFTSMHFSLELSEKLPIEMEVINIFHTDIM
jgi:hypothetical protein